MLCPLKGAILPHIYIGISSTFEFWYRTDKYVTEFADLLPEAVTLITATRR
jgi:hypothetical protein